ncbi:putative transposase, Ptta/En/Spm, plant [Lupinus albus]|uniref:Putative transposase, Ptta/En/Spm, plant n=1 Tax=Lupinus albus TaxID=3870 RepID=A0A6A4N275_LUPAL|nr:putative transposase, Ptta/En/Spm, plant [Lupinus albus]
MKLLIMSYYYLIVYVPKVKRFQNPFKSAPQSQRVASPIEDPTHYSPAINPTDPSLSVQAPSKATLDTTPPVHSSQAPNVSAPEVPEEFETFTNHVGRESTHYWIVEAIDLERVVKQIKVKVREVNNLPIGQRIILDFDEQGAAYGDAQGLLAGFLGTLASDCIPIDYDRWSGGRNGIPSTYFTECLDTIIKPRFCFRTSERISRRYCKLSLGRKWSASRQRLWDEFFNPAKTRDEIIRNVPIGIDKDQWTHFVHYPLRPSTVELCRKNKEIRKKQVIPQHTGGSKPNSRRRREMQNHLEDKLSHIVHEDGYVDWSS